VSHGLELGEAELGARDGAVEIGQRSRGVRTAPTDHVGESALEVRGLVRRRAVGDVAAADAAALEERLGQLADSQRLAAALDRNPSAVGEPLGDEAVELRVRARIVERSETRSGSR
jgi:hypothetical protein